MRAAIFQCAGGGLSVADRLGGLAAALQGEPLDLLVCPELFMSGYDVGASLLELAEPREGAYATQAAALARAHGVAIVYGYPERDGDTIYNSAACIDSKGDIIANHRKMLLPRGFESSCFRSGDALTLFELNGARCAILICYDAEFPETVRAVAEAGAQVVIVPTALIDRWASVALQMMPTRAFENGVWLLYANHAGVEGDSCYLGGSCIVAPDGSDSARAGAREQLISAPLDLRRISAARERLAYLQDAVTARGKLGPATSS